MGLESLHPLAIDGSKPDDLRGDVMSGDRYYWKLRVARRLVNYYTLVYF